MQLQVVFYRICFIAIIIAELSWGVYMSYFSIYQDPNDGFGVRLILATIAGVIYLLTYREWFQKYLNPVITAMAYSIAFQQLYYAYTNYQDYRVLFVSIPPVLLAILFTPTRKSLYTLTVLVNVIAFFIPQEAYYLSINIFTYSVMFCIFKLFFISYLEYLEQVKEKQKKSENLLSLGDFTKGMSHELNNQTMKMHLLATWLDVKGNLPDEAKERLVKLMKEIDNTSKITTKLKSLARSKKEKELVSFIDFKNDIKKMIDKRVVNLEIEHRYNIAFNEENDFIHINKKDLLILFDIIVKNALESFDDKQVVKVIWFDLWEKGNNIVIEISNNGKQIPPDMQDRIFNGFYSTKDVAANSGLGLTQALKIAYDHGGDLHLQSSSPYKTVFQFVLPK